MLKKIILVILISISLFLIYVAVIPGDYLIKREIDIDLSADKVFPYISSVKLADEWMPWKDQDPNLKMTYQGPESGVGATSIWESNGNMGQGKAEVVEQILNEKVKTKITYTKPMSFEQISIFKLTKKNENQTTMEWSVEGKNTFLGRLICTLGIINMDKYVGGEFEKGLKKLKGMAEKK
ncbi:SRPBCC family protein [Pigmentibacter ruber]|uniref:SRPBCC family protein n=1 Tax=Pigmentibacter ruber TaxID=2683196 RepID=UPI00131B1EE9|nr:SRPBCC family protein [Pigmentibacter ruber]BFD33427.1 hypothetical protein GTC16762_30450 [Pigmentibacter ruber]